MENHGCSRGVQVLRGPRPPSHKWPLAHPMQRQHQPRVSPAPQGPRVPPVRVSPDGSRDAARPESGETPTSTRGRGCRRSRCRVFEVGVGEGEEGFAETSSQCRGRRRKFIARSEKCLADLDWECELEQSVLTNTKVRLQRLEAEQTAPADEAPLPADWKAQMEALQAQVTAMWEERDQGPVAKRQAVGHIPSATMASSHQYPPLSPRSWTLGCKISSWISRMQ